MLQVMHQILGVSSRPYLAGRGRRTRKQKERVLGHLVLRRVEDGAGAVASVRHSLLDGC